MTTAPAEPMTAQERADALPELPEVPSWLEDLAGTLHRLATQHRGPARTALMLQAARCRTRAGITARAIQAQAEQHAAEVAPYEALALATVETIDQRGNLNTVDRLQVDQLRRLRKLAQVAAGGPARPQN